MSFDDLVNLDDLVTSILIILILLFFILFLDGIITLRRKK